MGIVLQFHSLPPDRRKKHTQVIKSGRAQGADTAEIVIFPGVQSDFNPQSNIRVAGEKHPRVQESPAE